EVTRQKGEVSRIGELTAPAGRGGRRVGMTGNQPGQVCALPRPAHLPGVPLIGHYRTDVLVCQGGRREWLSMDTGAEGCPDGGEDVEAEQAGEEEVGGEAGNDGQRG